MSKMSPRQQDDKRMSAWVSTLQNAQRDYLAKVEEVRSEEYRPVSERIAERTEALTAQRNLTVERAWRAGANVSFIAHNLGVSRNTAYAMLKGVMDEED